MIHFLDIGPVHHMYIYLHIKSDGMYFPDRGRETKQFGQ